MEQLFDVPTAAGLLGISSWTVRSYIARRLLKPVRIGKRVLLEGQELRRFIAECKKAQYQEHDASNQIQRDSNTLSKEIPIEYSCL